MATERKYQASLYQDIKNLMQYILDTECEDFIEQMECEPDISTEDLDKLAMQDRTHIYGCAVRLWHYLEDKKKHIKVPTIQELRDMTDDQD